MYNQFQHTINMSMAISKESYKDLKEYWDYQRLVEYNKELLKKRLVETKIKVFSQVGMDVEPEDVFDNIWNRMTADDFEVPSKDWIPLNEKYRFEWES